MPRIIINACGITTLAITIKLLCIGHDFNKGPIPDGFRKKCIRFTYFFWCRLGLFLAAIGLYRKHHEISYEKYLGPNYKAGYRDIKKASTIASNHVSWLDSLVLICEVCPGFCASLGFK